MEAWRTVVFSLVVLGIIGAVVVPTPVAKKFEEDFEDCRGLSAAACITAAIAIAYAVHGKLLQFVSAPEMMVVATTVGFEVLYAYGFEKAVPKRTRIYVMAIAALVVGFGGWRAYSAITEEFEMPGAVPAAWVFFTQALIWLAAFGVAFPAKVIATRSNQKPEVAHAPDVAAPSAEGTVPVGRAEQP
jgi:hypothetical protein